MTKITRMTVGGVLLAAAATLPIGGCDKVQEAQAGLCCSDFTVGADLSGVDFEASATFNAFAQASADFAATASAVATDLTNACRLIAVDLGADESAVTETDPAAKLTAWCNLAVTQIKAEITAKGSVSISYQPPVCTFSASAQASCEAKCTASVDCQAELGNIEARCDPGELSVKCEGQCTGSCEGSANLAVACEGTCGGTCDGTCEGTCEGKCDGNQSSGTCAGRCEGKCDAKCTGECRGSCQIEANANVQCNADCTGGCTGTAKAPKCTGELTPPSAQCQGEASCNGSCEASASAKAECKPPAVEIIATGSIDAQAVATLKANIPTIIAIFKVRGQLLLDNVNAIASISAQLDGGDFSAKAAACLIPIGNAIGQAVANIDASVKATASISGELKIQ